ncbi:MAG: DotI/IcmL family type IV secretion protein [Alphaproteobacteria bacterium]|nr:DotI/IcmL family type IV secretion protein [Alphaproteobacteria bacterium]
MKKIILITLLTLIVFPSIGKADTYDQKQGKSYQKTWSEGPPVSKAQFKAWVSLAASNVFDFSYKNYEERKQENQKFFTTLGYTSFYNALESAKIIELITEKKQTVSGYLLTAPRISPPILKNERYLWEVDFVFAVTYETEDSVTTQKLRVFMTVSEMENADEIIINDELSLFDLIGIRKWVAEPIANSDNFVCEEIHAKAEDVKEQEIDQLENENQSLKKRLQGLLDYIQTGSQK